MDVFHVTDRHGQKLADESLISYIEQSLGAGDEPSVISRSNELELTGADRPGLLSEVFAVLSDLRCVVAEAKLWTHKGRIAAIIFVKEELTAGLGLSGRPFLWAARPDLAANGSDINSLSFILNGKVVGWCPQQKVLSHPAIACFVSHCGWNSTLEGVRNGVPILCWPYFCDQFFNESYICDVWGIGLRMKADEKGIYRREEIGSKVEELVGDVGIRERCAAMKKMAAGSLKKGGSSLENLTTLAHAMKGL